MAIQISSTVKKATRLYEITATLTARSAISNPVYFVLHDETTQNEIKAKAGLPATTVFIAVVLLDNGYIGGTYFYDLLITLDPLPDTATSHTHDSSTLHHPLREAYRDGPYIDLDISLGPVDIYSDNAPGTVDYFRVHRDTADFFYIRSDGSISIGSHVEFSTDTDYDIGSVDNGATLRRPRDVYVGRDLYAARDALFGHSAKSPYYRFFPQGVNPDSSITERHIYWSTADNRPHAWDGTLDYPIGGAAGGVIGIYTNSPTVGIGHVVAVAGDNVVVRASASDLVNSPAIGICIDKPDANTAVVQLAGEIIIYPSGMFLPGRNYYLGIVPGTLVTDVTSYTTDMVVQRIGVSRTDQVLSLTLSDPLVL